MAGHQLRTYVVHDQEAYYVVVGSPLIERGFSFFFVALHPLILYKININQGSSTSVISIYTLESSSQSLMLPPLAPFSSSQFELK